MAIQAVTFDVWNTIYELADLSDIHLSRVEGWSSAEGLPVGEGQVMAAIAAATRAGFAAWRDGRGLGLPGLVERMLVELGARRGAQDVAELVGLLGQSLEDRRLPPAAGVGETLHRLRRDGVRLGIVSDTSWTTGKQLRADLSRDGWLDLFEASALVFSDEFAVSKPDPRLFRAALAELQVSSHRAAHVGDIRRSDIAGARAAGMVTVRYIGCFDDPTEGPEADVILTQLADLPDALLSLSTAPEVSAGGALSGAASSDPAGDAQATGGFL